MGRSGKWVLGYKESGVMGSGMLLTAGWPQMTMNISESYKKGS